MAPQTLVSGDGLWAYVFLALAGFAATEPWRFLGVVLSKNVGLESEVLIWVRADGENPHGTGKRFDGYGYFNRYPDELLTFLERHFE